jgi:hypothetical protein
VAGNAELGAGVRDAERLFDESSAADFALGVDETTRFRDEAAASAFTSHSISLLPSALTYQISDIVHHLLPSLQYNQLRIQWQAYDPSLLPISFHPAHWQCPPPSRAIGAISIKATSCYTAQPGIGLHMADRLSFGSRWRCNYCRR